MQIQSPATISAFATAPNSTARITGMVEFLLPVTHTSSWAGNEFEPSRGVVVCPPQPLPLGLHRSQNVVSPEKIGNSKLNLKEAKREAELKRTVQERRRGCRNLIQPLETVVAIHSSGLKESQSRLPACLPPVLPRLLLQQNSPFLLPKGDN